MPPKVKFGKESVMESALTVVRERGLEALSARSIAERLGCSTRPIYSVYDDMEKLKADLFNYANQFFGRYLADFSAKENRTDSGFMKFGLAYIAFARAETNLFKMLFLSRNIDSESISDLVSPTAHAFILDTIPRGSGEAEDKSEIQQHFLDIWLYTHGLATMAAFGGIDLPENEIMPMLTRVSKAFFARSK
ncbi:transcriptional regulator [Clostridia bacterium]|nr:transcriptional regulator [Clostridia bacterium]